MFESVILTEPDSTYIAPPPTFSASEIKVVKSSSLLVILDRFIIILYWYEYIAPPYADSPSLVIISLLSMLHSLMDNVPKFS